jgi:L-ascorbate metabolism protein UlaG (beta-lactamase superfamily)
VIWLAGFGASRGASVLAESARHPAQAAAAAAQDPLPGGALVWYLGHCGYAVRTANHLLIFDYQERRDGPQPKTRPDDPSLARGWIDPREIKGLKVRVFVSHAHEDHYDPVISTWRAGVPDIAYYFGWKVADNPADHYLVGPRAEIRSGGIEIATINSHHSGVPEVAWLVKVDGLVLYHNGDCQPNDPRAEYRHLRTKTESIDLAFVPPVYEDGLKYTLQNAELFTRFRVRAAFPMHVRADDARYHAFQKAAQARFPDVPVRIPTVMGQRFVYAEGRIQDR